MSRQLGVGCSRFQPSQRLRLLSLSSGLCCAKGAFHCEPGATPWEPDHPKKAPAL